MTKYQSRKYNNLYMVLSNLKSMVLMPQDIDKLRKKELVIRMTKSDSYVVGATVAIKTSYFQPNEDAPLFAKINRITETKGKNLSERENLYFISTVPHPKSHRAPIVSQKEDTGINTPENISKAMKVVDAFTSNGIEKFEEIINSIVKKYGNIKPDFFQLIKNAYAQKLMESFETGLTDFTKVKNYQRKDFVNKSNTDSKISELAYLIFLEETINEWRQNGTDSFRLNYLKVLYKVGQIVALKTSIFKSNIDADLFIKIIEVETTKSDYFEELKDQRIYFEVTHSPFPKSISFKKGSPFDIPSNILKEIADNFPLKSKLGKSLFNLSSQEDLNSGIIEIKKEMLSRGVDEVTVSASAELFHILLENEAIQQYNIKFGKHLPVILSIEKVVEIVEENIPETSHHHIKSLLVAWEETIEEEKLSLGSYLGVKSYQELSNYVFNIK